MRMGWEIKIEETLGKHSGVLSGGSFVDDVSKNKEAMTRIAFIEIFDCLIYLYVILYLYIRIFIYFKKKKWGLDKGEKK